MKTLIIGASVKPERYSYKAAQKLTEHGHEIFLIGNRAGNIFNTDIVTDKLPIDGIHTVTMYISSKYQAEYYDYIISLSPKRVIFNPGTENVEFVTMLQRNGIEAEVACTLVLLSTNVF